MRKVSFKRGMGKLMSRGMPKRKAFTRMSSIAWKNRVMARSGQTKKSRYLAQENLRRVSRVRR